jgi:hypothetical protein
MLGSLNLNALLCQQARFFSATSEGEVQLPPTRKGKRSAHLVLPVIPDWNHSIHLLTSDGSAQRFDQLGRNFPI